MIAEKTVLCATYELLYFSEHQHFTSRVGGVAKNFRGEVALLEPLFFGGVVMLGSTYTLDAARKEEREATVHGLIRRLKQT